MKTQISKFLFFLFLGLVTKAHTQELTKDEQILADSLEFSYDILKLVRSNTSAEFKRIPKNDQHDYSALVLSLERKAANALLNELSRAVYQLNSKGYIVFKAIHSDDGESDEIRIVKHDDPLYPIKYMKTQGAYPKLSTEQIFDKIERWHGRKGCVVLGAGKNWVKLKFVLTLEDTDAFAKEMITFCPALSSVYRGFERLSEKLNEDKPEILLEW